MTPNNKKFHPFRWILIAAFSTVIIAACNDNKDKDESKPVATTPAEAKKDSLPPIDKTDTLTTTAPETIKNK